MNGMADNTYIKDTEKEFSEVRALCRDIFEKKLFDKNCPLPLIVLSLGLYAHDTMPTFLHRSR